MKCPPFKPKLSLIGMPGSGKTWLANALKKELGFNALDLDHYFEAQSGMTIPQFWNQYGEAEFRVQERCFMFELLDSQVSIIAMGGGTPCFFNNLDCIKKQSLCIYIKADLVQLEAKNDFIDRPHFASNSSKSDFLNKLYQQRKKWYERADLIIENDFNELNVLDNVKNICINYFKSKIL
ncbi:MAG: shikimate kinase [Saprospiraceae bacterium]